MDSLYSTFQQVLESGREDPYEATTASPTADFGSSDAEGKGNGLPQLPDDVATLKRIVASKQEAFDNLYQDSMAIQADLAKVTRHLSIQRELWMSTLLGQENVIQRLVEGAVAATGSLDHGTEGLAPHPTEEGGVYVNALLEQIEMLKMSLSTATNEREEATTSLRTYLKEQIGTTDAEYSVALKKLNAFWDTERTNYERQVEELSSTIARMTESMDMLTQTHNEEVDNLRNAKRALVENLAGARSDAGVPTSLTVGPPSASVENISGLESSPQERSNPSEDISPGKVTRDSSQRQPDQGTLEEEVKTLQNEVDVLRTELQHTQQECRAREDALTAMYEDNRRLEEENARLVQELSAHRNMQVDASSLTRDLRQQLLDRDERIASLSTSLEVLRSTHQRLQQDFARLQDTAAKHAKGTGIAAPSASGSVFRASDGVPQSAGMPPSLVSRSAGRTQAEMFVLTANEKLAQSSEKTVGLRVHGSLRVILAAAILLVLGMFLVLAFGSNCDSATDGAANAVGWEMYHSCVRELRQLQKR